MLARRMKVTTGIKINRGVCGKLVAGDVQRYTTDRPVMLFSYNVKRVDVVTPMQVVQRHPVVGVGIHKPYTCPTLGFGYETESTLHGTITSRR